MKTLLILCLVLIGLAGFTSTKAAAATAPVAVHQNYTEIVVGGGPRYHHRHYYRHYHHRRYYYRHHRRYYY